MVAWIGPFILLFAACVYMESNDRVVYPWAPTHEIAPESIGPSAASRT